MICKKRFQVEIRDMAKKFNVLRDALSQESQNRAQAQPDQMLADISRNEEGEVCGPAQVKKPTLPKNTQKHYFT
jgi:hypothetical protein